MVPPNVRSGTSSRTFAPRLGDAEEADRRGAEDPDPVFRAFVLPAGLVDVQDRLGGKAPSQPFIRPSQGVADTRDGVAQVTSAHVDVQPASPAGSTDREVWRPRGVHLATEVSQAGIDGVQRTLHVRDQGLQTRAEQLAFDDASRTFRPNHLPAHRTTIPMEAILGDLKRILSQLGNSPQVSRRGDLLDLGLPGRFEFARVARFDARRAARRAVVPMRATRGMKFLDVVDLVGAKRRTIDARRGGGSLALGGLTMSLEGGLEELVEFLDNRATCSVSRST